MRAHRVTTPIRLDGKLDEPIYASTPAISNFVQQEPDEFKPATEKTESWIFFDDDNIYVSARCYESHPERRVANEMRRDTAQLRQNDTFLVMFDTYHDRRNGYLFYANAIGGLADSQVTDEGPPNVDWNTVWDVKTGNFDGGWTIEMAIPFKSLRYQPGVDQTWGINLRRVVRWKNEWSYLAQVPRALTTFRGVLKISSAGTLEGLQVPSGSRNLEVKPYALAGVSTDRTVTPMLSNDQTGRIGGDLKYGITQNITADLTINTDFSQVEVDEQQVNLTRFNLFFPEKRDFFLEGLGTFAFAGRASAGLGAGFGDTPYLFFSRRIGLDGSRVIPLRAGGRTSGKAGKFTFGAINVQTGDDEIARVESANFTVLRAKRDILRRSSIGGMFTHRTATPGRVGSNDGFGARRVDVVLSERPVRRVSRRHAHRGPRGRQPELSRLLRLQRRQVRPPARSPGRRTELSSRGRVRAPHRHAAQLRPGALQPAADVDTQPAQAVGVGQHQLPHQHARSARHARSGGVVPGRAHQQRRGERDLHRQLRTAGPAVCDCHRRDAAGRRLRLPHHAPRLHCRPAAAGVGRSGVRDRPFYNGDRKSIAVNMARMQVTPQLSLEPSLSINWVDLVQGSFTAKVARTRATYTITPRMFVSGIVQYNSATTSVGSNLRFRWEYRPGSELFVVYTDDYDSDPRPNIEPLRNRAFVVKFNRLFRL